MSGITPNVIYSVARVRTCFADDIGNRKTGTGTGFWILHPTKGAIFVTNKHNVDPSIKLSQFPNLKLFELEVEIRKFQKSEGDTVQALDETKFFMVQNIETCLKSHSTADCAVLIAPDFLGIDSSFLVVPQINLSDVADGAWLVSNSNIMDVASFIGFPGHRGVPWWDEKRSLPIARLAAIASEMKAPFENRQIKTSHASLISGLSFTGSSGSPLLLHEKGVKPGMGLTGGGYVPPKLVGIMTGHFEQQDDPNAEVPAMFRHGGLSYFTRSDAFLEMISGA